jgi:hypothetical protein
MGLRDRPRRAPKEPQGILPFEFETTGEPEDVTARAGLPLVAETMQMLAEGVRRLQRVKPSKLATLELDATCIESHKREAVPDKNWALYQERSDVTVHWTEVEFTAGHWDRQAAPLRTIVLRLLKRQEQLFPSGSDRLHLAIVTNDRVTDGAALLRWHYRLACPPAIRPRGASARRCLRVAAHAPPHTRRLPLAAAAPVTRAHQAHGLACCDRPVAPRSSLRTEAWRVSWRGGSA